jgi:hypothetical protein
MHDVSCLLFDGLLGSFSSGFNKVCSVTADLSSLRNALQQTIVSDGSRYWIIHLFVCIRFGVAEPEAFIEWEENVGHQLSSP